MKTLWLLYRIWFKMGLFTFGGGYAMLPMIQRELIEKHHWVTEEEILDYYAIGQCLPGVIAVNTALFVGYHKKGVAGSIAAMLGVVTPSFVIILLIAMLMNNFAEISIVQHALRGINVAVCMLMIYAVLNLWQKNIVNITSFCIFFIALLLSIFSSISTMWLIILSGVAGVLLNKWKGLHHD